MSKYGEVAVHAIELLQANPTHPGGDQEKSCRDAWNQVINSSSEKVCPRTTFLALCATGDIKKIDKFDHSRPTSNRKHALDALNYLRCNKSDIPDAKTLWKLVAGGKTHNNQMDVVLSIWNKELISR